MELGDGNAPFEGNANGRWDEIDLPAYNTRKCHEMLGKGGLEVEMERAEAWIMIHWRSLYT